MALFLAVFVAEPGSAAMVQWAALDEAERTRRQQAGAQAWREWITKHGDAILQPGGPLGVTTRVSKAGAQAGHNPLSAFHLVSADSAQAATALFENHPHFNIFPGDAVEIMPILQPPGND